MKVIDPKQAVRFNKQFVSKTKIDSLNFTFTETRSSLFINPQVVGVYFPHLPVGRGFSAIPEIIQNWSETILQSSK